MALLANSYLNLFLLETLVLQRLYLRLVRYLGVGKTSILKRYLKNKFTDEYQTTVGVEFGSKYVDIDEYYRVKLQIWDTVGIYGDIVVKMYRQDNSLFII